MPLQRCETDGRTGFQWGQAGRCYTYRTGNAAARGRARKRALKQGRAIEAAPLHEGHRRVVGVGVRTALERNEQRLLGPARRLVGRLSRIVTADEWRDAAALRRLPNSIHERLAGVLAASEEEMAAALRVPRSFTEQIGADDLARIQIASLIRELSDEALSVIQAQLGILFDRGSHEEILRAIARASGLTTRQLLAVERARQAALAQGLTSSKAADAASRVRQRLLASRAKLIARTESARFVNAVVQERGEELALQGNVVTRQWVSARDGNVDGGDPGGPCQRNDNGERFGLADVFPSGDAQPPAHPGCRCVLEIWVEE